MAIQTDTGVPEMSTLRGRVDQLAIELSRDGWNMTAVGLGEGRSFTMPPHLRSRIATLFDIDNSIDRSKSVMELTDKYNDEIALMANIAYNSAAIQKFLNHDVKKLTQEILKASCSQASQCTNNNEAVNDLPRAIDQILDGMQLDNQGQGRSNRSR